MDCSSVILERTVEGTHMNIAKHFSLLVFLLSAAAIFPANGQEEDKYKLKPTPDAAAKFKVYVPANLVIIWTKAIPNSCISTRLK